MKLWCQLPRMVILAILTTASAFAAAPSTSNQPPNNVNDQGGNLVLDPAAGGGSSAGIPGAMTGPIKMPPPGPEFVPPQPSLNTGGASGGDMPQSDLGQTTMGGEAENNTQLNANQQATGTPGFGNQAPPPSN